MVPAEVILAQNAVRIADLWSDLEQADKAKAARDEARQYLEQALADADKGSDLYSEIEQKIDALAKP